MADFKILSAMMCEDARRDENGQYFLVGIIGAGYLNNRSFPTTKKNLKAYVLGETSSAALKLEFKLKGRSSTEALVQGEIGFERQDGQDTSMTKVDFDIDFGGTSFPVPDEYLFQLKNEGGRWKTAASFDYVHKK